jgi:DNA-binding transcriptional regulator YdaS (Cro superfamily)
MERLPPGYSIAGQHGETAPFWSNRVIEIVRQAANRVGGIVELGRKLGINHTTFYQWTQVPVGRVLEIEKITGIARSKIRPDIYPPRKRKT